MSPSSIAGSHSDHQSGAPLSGAKRHAFVLILFGLLPTIAFYWSTLVMTNRGQNTAIFVAAFQLCLLTSVIWIEASFARQSITQRVLSISTLIAFLLVYEYIAQVHFDGLWGVIAFARVLASMLALA